MTMHWYISTQLARQRQEEMLRALRRAQPPHRARTRTRLPVPWYRR